MGIVASVCSSEHSGIGPASVESVAHQDMGCCHPGGMFGPELVMDEDLAPVCQRLNLSVYQAMQMYEKFKEIDQDMSGVIDLEEFFEHLSEEKTPFATQLFTLIDENASGELDFNEFLAGLWNICTFEEESLLRFAFDLVDTDGSGYVDGDEMEGMIKNLHGTKYNKNLFIHTKKVLKQYDTNGDNQFSFDEFKKCHKKLPLLFMPAFGLRTQRFKKSHQTNTQVSRWQMQFSESNKEERAKFIKRRLIQIRCGLMSSIQPRSVACRMEISCAKSITNMNHLVLKLSRLIRLHG